MQRVYTTASSADFRTRAHSQKVAASRFRRWFSLSSSVTAILLLACSKSPSNQSPTSAKSEAQAKKLDDDKAPALGVSVAFAELADGTAHNRDQLSLTLVVPNGWHIYWKNPGDAGLPPKFSLLVDEKKIEISDVLHPVPHRHVGSGGVSSYIHEHATPFLLKLRSPLPATANAQLDIDYLICNENGCQRAEAQARFQAASLPSKASADETFPRDQVVHGEIEHWDEREGRVRIDNAPNISDFFPLNFGQAQIEKWNQSDGKIWFHFRTRQSKSPPSGLPLGIAALRSDSETSYYTWQFESSDSKVAPNSAPQSAE